MKLTPILYSPAYPAAWLLFGMPFALAIAHFVAIPWPQLATIAVYTVALVWVSVLAWRGQRHLWPVTTLDGLFVGFVSLVSVSLVSQGGIWGEMGKFARYLPFMVVVPYLCGRLMRVSDIVLFMRITLVAGITLLPLLLSDRLTSAGRPFGRWPFFGQDHGALLAGVLLTAALIALCVRMLDFRSLGERTNRSSQVFLNGLAGLFTVFLVWVTARGWLLSALVGVAVTCLFARQRSIWRRVGLWTAIVAVVGLSLSVLPKLDPYFGRFYALPMNMDSHMESIEPFLGVTVPILGEASCQPFKDGVNSIAMRWVLYQEAMAMFSENPVFGVGAARFGEQSCTGPMGFPHSTILQGGAELGLIGGGLLVGLMMLAAVTLARPFLSVWQGPNWSAHAFVLALFAAFQLGDQIYGNYFMSVGTWLLLGIAASMRAVDNRGHVNRG
ncbi:O-antigen ligase family protein [Thiobacillus sp.]|uniref:O-antigen ligase family protein n=1 Tax=Thiobacillus sp. TaxID=924 RepID=UPI0025E8FA6B|nr:O-antigen ligase family protein [Thiobacillus sp.]